MSIFISALIYGVLALHAFSAGAYVERNETFKVSPEHSPSLRAEIRTFTVTAYSPKETCVYGPKCLMANGKPPKEGYIACPRSMLLGSKLEVQGMVYECGDRLSKKYDHRIDIFMDSHAEAIKFGKRQLPVTILK